MQNVRVDLGSASVRMVQLKERHDELEKRLAQLERHLSLTPDEQLERSRLKKEKLRTKDELTRLGACARLRVSGWMNAADEQAAWLDKIRRSGIRVDREGRFIHEGAEVTHEGLKRALFRWLDRLPPPDGRYVLRLDERRFAYLEDVADTPLVARAARIDAAGAVQLALSDGSEEALDPGDADHRRRRRAARLGARRPPGGAARQLRRRGRRRPRHRGRRSSTAAARGPVVRNPATVGSVTTKRAPPSGDGCSSTWTSPPWSSRILRTIARPRPVPCSLVVK